MQNNDSIVERVKNLQIVKRIKSVKNIKIILLAIIIALALIIYSSVTTKVESTSYMNDDETRLATILSSVDGAGEVQTFISKNSGKIVGVLVLSDGANNPLVRIRLVDATSSALGVDAKIVSVLQRSEK